MTNPRQTIIHFTLTLILGASFFNSDECMAMSRRAAERQYRSTPSHQRHHRRVQPARQQNQRVIKTDQKDQNYFEPFFHYYNSQKTPLSETLRNTLQTLTFKKKVHPDQEKKDGYTLLMHAAHFGDLETAKLLLQAGAHLEETDPTGRTAWIIAARAHQTPSLLYLKDAGAQINHLDAEGRSALYYAANLKNFHLFTELLLMGVATPIHQKLGFSQEWIYQKAKNIEMGWHLLQNSHTVDEFLYAKSILSAEFIDDKPLPANVKHYIHRIGQKIYFSQKYEELRQPIHTQETPSEIVHETTPNLIETTSPESKTPLTPRGDREALPLDELNETTLPGAPSEESTPGQTCIICQDQPLISEEIVERHLTAPANCDCFVCIPCGKTWIEFQIGHCSEISYTCPGCDQTISLDYFKKHGCTEEQITKLSQVFVERKLDEHPNWYFCPAQDCSAGRILLEGESSFYSCFLCEFEGCIKCGESHFGGCEQSKIENEATQKELEFLVNEGKQAPPPNRNDITPDDPLYYKGRFRPCYFCGTLIERTIGCNSMDCPQPKCRKKWHWNYGDHKLHPQNTGRSQTAILHDQECIEAQYTPLKPAHF